LSKLNIENRMSSAFIIEEWRDLWSYKGDFVITCFAYVFSQSSLLSLPKLFIENGGGAFAIAYLVSLLFCCLPLIMMELSIGQQCASAPPKSLFNICPLLAGVGSAFILYSLVISSLLASYVSYILSFLVHLFTNIEEANPPWALCSSEWSTVPCVDGLAINNSGQTSLNNVKEFFDLSVLNVTTRIEESGDLQWMLISGIAGTWFMVFLALFLGVKWLGKVCYFTFIIPLLLLLTLLVKSLSSNGANHLLQDVFETDWNVLLKVETWVQAFAQSLYGTGLCFGAYITLGSFNKRNNNVFGDGLLIIVIHTALSALGFVTLSAMLGIFKSKFSIPSSVVLTDGFSQILNLLASASHFDQPQLWSTLVLMLFLFLFLNILYILMLNVQTSIEDAIGDSASKFFPRFGISFATCCIGFVASLGYASQAGFYASQLMMKFIDLLCPWTLLAFELFAVAWLYCAHLLARDTSRLISNKPSKFLLFPFFELLYILPAVPVFIIVIKMWNYNFRDILKDNQASPWMELVGWSVSTVILLPIIIGMLYCTVKTCIHGPGFTVWEKFKYTILSPMRYEVPKIVSVPRYSSTAPGYVLLPHAPLAEPEQFNDIYSDRQQTRVSKI
ncbi:Sodium- and chloride-dependent GABA transporter ine, partial [Trichinella pseudospiralis]